MSAWDAIKKHLPHVAAKAELESVKAERQDRRTWETERAPELLRVLERAVTLAREKYGTIGACVSKAAKMEAVELAEDEEMKMVLATARAYVNRRRDER